MNPTWWIRLRGDWLFWALVAAVVVLSLANPRAVAGYPALVDWHTIWVMTGLLVLTRGLEGSGALHRVARVLVRRVATERGLAVTLVLLAAGLSMVITNDVALFVVVRLTLSLGAVDATTTARLVVFQALAVNAGSALTPIGNPQNMFLWQLSGVSAETFLLAMLPLVALMKGGLLVLTALAFGGRRLEIDRRPPAGLERPLLAVSLALYVPFLLLANAGMPGVGLLLVAAVFVAVYREVLRRVDWPLLAIFVLMFIAFRSLADVAALRGVIEGWAGAGPEGLFVSGALLSQAISNVPAAIVLAEFPPDWRTIAWGVSVGGFGTAIASLANIIALRMMGDRRVWVTFHLYAVPFLAVMLAVVVLWLGS